MYNTTPYNSQPFGGGLAPNDLEQDLFVFNGYSLHKSDGSVRIQGSNHDDLGTIDLDTFNAPRVDGGGVLGHYYRGKTVTLPLTLKADTSDALNDLIDDFKRNTKETEGRLEIKVNGIVRRAKASITDLKFGREYFHITFVSNVSISFETMDPHRQLKDATSVTYTNITAELNEEITNNGSQQTFSKYYFLFGAGTSSVDSVEILVGNYTMAIDGPFNNGDILVVDGEEKEVLLNGTDIDYTGIFQEFEVGPNPVRFSFNGGSVNVDITNLYNTKYR